MKTQESGSFFFRLNDEIAWSSTTAPVVMNCFQSLRIGRGATYPQQSIFRLVNVLFRIGVWHHHRDSFEWRNTGMPQRYWVWILVCLQTHHTHTDTHAHERTRPCSTVRRKSRFSVGHFRLPRLLFDCKLTPGSVWTTTRYASAPTIRRDSPTRLGKRTYI